MLFILQPTDIVYRAGQMENKTIDKSATFNRVHDISTMLTYLIGTVLDIECMYIRLGDIWRLDGMRYFLVHLNVT